MRARRGILAASLVVISSATVAAQIPVGSEFRVDTRGGALSFLFAVPRSTAMNRDGNFVVAWAESISGNVDVVARRYDSAGRPKAPDFRVNTYTTGRQYQEAVGMDDAGNFVIAWVAEGPVTPIRVTAQRFDAAGARIGSDFLVSTSTAAQLQPAVAVAPGGSFVIAWIEADGDTWGIFARRYDNSGTPQGPEFQVNTYTAGQQYVPTVDTDEAGNFVVVWTTSSPSPSYGGSGHLFLADGSRLGGEFRINSGPERVVRPRVARSRSGSFAAVWTAFSRILARRFDGAGSPIGADFAVNTSTTGPLDRPDVDMDADGDFVVTWQDSSQSSGDIFGRRFDSSGIGGPEFRANSYTTGVQGTASVAMDPAGNFVIAWHSYLPQTSAKFAQRYAGGLLGTAVGVDGVAGASSDGNGVLEAGETVRVAPFWLNANPGAQSFTGVASAFTGPGTSTYSIADGAAGYGTVASGDTGSCLSTSDCYAMGISVPATRPVLHWDATFREDISPANLGATKPWRLHIGDSFSDVPRTSPFYRFVETLLHHDVTGGCTSSAYCPSFATTRDQMAVFALVAKEGAGYTPPPCSPPNQFADVPETSPFCAHIEELANRGVVAGCGNGNYCPSSAVSREQMAVFMLRTLDPALTPPQCAAPVFTDVPATSPFCPWIEELARRGVVAGCGGGNYCPSAAVTREQMSVFIGATFTLALYGP